MSCYGKQVDGQCRALWIGRSSLYYQPKGERAASVRMAPAVCARQELVGRGGMNGNGSRSIGDTFRSGQQRLDPVGDVLRRRAELGDGPVGGVAFGDVVRAGVVDEAFREGGGQHQLALGDGDEAVPQADVAPGSRTRR